MPHIYFKHRIAVIKAVAQHLSFHVV